MCGKEAMSNMYHMTRKLKAQQHGYPQKCGKEMFDPEPVS